LSLLGQLFTAPVETCNRVGFLSLDLFLVFIDRSLLGSDSRLLVLDLGQTRAEISRVGQLKPCRPGVLTDPCELLGVLALVRRHRAAKLRAAKLPA